VVVEVDGGGKGVDGAAPIHIDEAVLDGDVVRPDLEQLVVGVRTGLQVQALDHRVGGGHADEVVGAEVGLVAGDDGGAFGPRGGGVGDERTVGVDALQRQVRLVDGEAAGGRRR